MKQRLTNMEMAVLFLCISNAQEYQEEGRFNYDETGYEKLGITTNQKKGYLGELTKKGYIEALQGVYFSHRIIDLECR